LEHNFVGAETWTLRKIEKYLESFESFEMWCCKRMEKVSLSDSVKNEILHGVKEERNILYTIKRRKADWIGHILPRNRFLKHVIEGRLEAMGRRRRRKQLQDDLNEKKAYWHLKEETLDHAWWRTGFGISYGPIARQTT